MQFHVSRRCPHQQKSVSFLSKVYPQLLRSFFERMAFMVLSLLVPMPTATFDTLSLYLVSFSTLLSRCNSSAFSSSLFIVLCLCFAIPSSSLACIKILRSLTTITISYIGDPVYCGLDIACWSILVDLLFLLSLPCSSGRAWSGT